MIDVKLPLRTAYYQLLNTAIIYNSIPVPVSTDVKKLTDSAATTYIIISGQSGTDISTFSNFESQEDILIDIVCKGKTRVNREIVDQIAGQILHLILPSPGKNGLPPQAGIQIDCVQKSMDKELDLVLNAGTTANRRLLTFTQKVAQTGTFVAPPAPFLFQSPIHSIDFAGDPTHYENPALKNLEYDIFLNDASVYLDEGVEWQKLVDGGFQILIPGFDASTKEYTIYINRK